MISDVPPPAGVPDLSAAIADVLADVLADVQRHGREDHAARLSELARRLDRPARHVVVVGEFKAGKSSLVNALLNVRVCPTDADVATAVPSYVRHGDELAVRARTGRAPEAPGAEATTGLSLAEAGAAAVGALDGVRALDVTVPRQLLRNGLVLVDTPGVGGGLGSAHAAVALRALRESGSVAIVVSDAAAEYSAAELELVETVAAECPRVLCVLTKTDLHPGWRRVAAADRSRLAARGLALDLLPVSATLRHAGLREGDRALVAESGFPDLAAWLLDAARDGGGPLAAEAAAAARSVTAQLVTEATQRRAVLAGAADAVVAGAAWEAEERLATELQGAGARWQHVLSDQLGDLQAEVDVDLVTRLRALRKQAVARVAELPPARMAADLAPWLQRRTAEELLDHVRGTRSGAQRVVDAVAAEFGSAAGPLRAAVDVAVAAEPGDAAAGVPLELPTAATVGGEAGVAALRGGATGAVVANAAGLVFGIALPVLAPVTAVLAGVLAGKSWQGARTSQVRQLRLELERAVVAYLDDVDVLARKESRTAVRALHRRLQDAFGDSARELAETARRTARQLRDDAAHESDRRRAALAELDGEIERLRALHARCGRLVAAAMPSPGAAGRRGTG